MTPLLIRLIVMVIITNYCHANEASVTIHPFLRWEIGAFEKAFGTADWFLNSAIDRDALIEQLSKGEALRQGNVSESCLESLLVQWYGTVTGQEWAIYMRDANGRASIGIYEGNFVWEGNYDQCKRDQTKATAWMTPQYYLNHTFDGQYCNLYHWSSILEYPVIVGLCAPSTCTEYDVTELFRGVLPDTSTRFYIGAQCREDIALADSTAAIIMTVILVVFGVLVIVATITQYCYTKRTHATAKTASAVMESDRTNKNGLFTVTPDAPSAPSIPEISLHNGLSNGTSISSPSTVELTGGIGNEPQKPGKGMQLLFSFSLLTTLPRVMTASLPPGSYSCMCGVRFLAFGWICLGHVWQLGLYVFPYNANAAENYWQQYDIFNKFHYQAILEMHVAVETFFVLSGSLVTISFIKTMSRQNNRITFRQMVLYYFHRYWRLTPVYMVILGAFASYANVVATGPVYPSPFYEAEACKENFWLNLIYLNNLFNLDWMCVSWSWYLANDMQFYCIAPLFIFFMYRWPPIGFRMLKAVFLAHIGLTGYLFYGTAIGERDYYSEYYFPPWTRFGSYAIGMMLGYCICISKCSVRIHKGLVALGWLVACVMLFMSVYGAHMVDDNVASRTAFSGVFQRPMHALGVSWIIFACCNGYGGVINTILSWKFFVPLSRVTFVGYLIHPILIYCFYFSSPRQIYVNVANMIVYYGALMVYCVAASFVLKLVFEEPFLLLEKVIIPKQKKTKSDKRSYTLGEFERERARIATTTAQWHNGTMAQ